MDLAGIDVSRETIDRLKTYQALVEKWNPSINLIAKSTLSAIWERHILDSAQIARFVVNFPEKWGDFGSGAGFPGLVVATIAKELSPGTKFRLIESDVRKSTFLRTVIRTLDLNASVDALRIENAKLVQAQIISARALASLDQLFEYATPHLENGGKLLFLKGQTYESEIEIARKNWKFEVVTHPSITDNRSKIIEAWNLESIR